jgi:hypothetical protein
VPLRARSLVALAALVLAGCNLFQEKPRVTAAPASGAGAWEAGPPALEPLTEVAAAAHAGQIWVAGGMASDGQAVATVQVLDPEAGSWEPGPGLPTPVHHASLVSDGEHVVLVGGYGPDGRPSDRVFVLDDVDWVEHRPLPEPRAAGAAAWDGAGRLVYAGGVGPDGVSDDVWARVERGWEPYGRLSEPLEHLAATSDGDGTVVVLGGRRGGLDTNSARATLIDADGARSLGEVPTRRGGVAAFWWPSLGACLVGGESPEGTHAEVECIAADGRLTSLPGLARPRHGLGAAVLDGSAYVVLGGEQPGLFVSDAVEVLALP